MQKLSSKTRPGGPSTGPKPSGPRLEQTAAPTQTPHGMTVAPGQHAAKAYMGIAGHMPGRQAAQPLSPHPGYGPVNTGVMHDCPYCGQPMPGSMHNGSQTPYAAL